MRARPRVGQVLALWALLFGAAILARLVASVWVGSVLEPSARDAGLAAVVTWVWAVAASLLAGRWPGVFSLLICFVGLELVLWLAWSWWVVDWLDLRAHHIGTLTLAPWVGAAAIAVARWKPSPEQKRPLLVFGLAALAAGALVVLLPSSAAPIATATLACFAALVLAVTRSLQPAAWLVASVLVLLGLDVVLGWSGQLRQLFVPDLPRFVGTLVLVVPLQALLLAVLLAAARRLGGRVELGVRIAANLVLLAAALAAPWWWVASSLPRAAAQLVSVLLVVAAAVAAIGATTPSHHEPG